MFGRWRERAPVVLYAIVTFGLVVTASGLYSQHRNTLHHNGRWLTTKTDLERAVIGGIAYRTTRPALARSRLHLGAWNGFQEVVFHRRLPIAEVAFDFQLTADAYLAIVFDANERGFSGLRLSANRRFPSLYFMSTSAGRFITTKVLRVDSLRPAGWNHLRVTFTASGSSIYLNDARPIDIPAVVQRDKVIGFRGGSHDALVDNVRATSADGRVVLRESFSNIADGIRAGPVMLALVLLLHGLVFALRRSFGLTGRAPETHSLIAVSCGALVLLLPTWGIDWYFLSGRYPISPPYYDYPIHALTEQQVVDDIRRRYPITPQPTKTRILFLGSSQTWGAGARYDRDAWPQLIQEKLDRRADGGEYEGVNAGLSGADSSSLLRHFAAEWIELDPRLVIVDLGNNGIDPARFAGDLRQFVRLTRARRAGLLFVLEPVSIETPAADVFARHEVMRSVARELEVPLLDMNAYLDLHHDAGFLFWDQVHLTTAGQEIFAERLYQEIDRMLGNAASGVSSTGGQGALDGGAVVPAGRGGGGPETRGYDASSSSASQRMSWGQENPALTAQSLLVIQ